MYSCVAGFVDPGESLIECVARECAEEAGVVIDPESFQMTSSQHWPNPAGSLMCGCIVTTETTLPSPCQKEVEDIKWFSPAELKDALAFANANPALRFGSSTEGQNDPLFVPPRGAIANSIITTWLKEYHKL